MKLSRTVLKFGSVLAGVFLVAIVAARTLPAAFTSPPTTTHVEIDGIDFGAFNLISGLEQFSKAGTPQEKDQFYVKVTLKRDFVTAPSLYLWAKNRRSKKTDLQNIHLVTKSLDGQEISRQTLELCQPLSWTVEKANPSLGGFNETIDLAVQKLSIL